MFWITFVVIVIVFPVPKTSAGNETSDWVNANPTPVDNNNSNNNNNINANSIENDRRILITTCPSGWHRFKSKCYHFNRAPATFYDTIKYCTSFPYNSKMVILHSKEEEEFLSRLIFVKFKDSSPWLGGTQVAPGSPDYKWIDGSPFDYHNWQEPDEPDCGSSCCGIQLDYYEVDNVVDTSEKGSHQQQPSHLMLFNKTIKTFWRDVNCNKELKRVCQIELSHGLPSQDIDGSGDPSSLEESVSTENEVDQETLKFQEVTSYDLETLINMTRLLDLKAKILIQKSESLSKSIENTQRSIIDSEINSSKNFYTVRAAHEEFRQLMNIFTRDDYYFRINWTTLLKQQSVDIKNLVDKSQMVACRKPFDPMNVGQTVETLSSPSDSDPDSHSSSNFPLESLLVENSTQSGQDENENVITLKGLKQNLDHVSKVIINETKRLNGKIDNLSRGQRNISYQLTELESLQRYYSLPTIMLVITLIMTCASLSLILSIYLNMTAFKKSTGKCCSTCAGSRQDFEMVQRLDSNSNYKNR